MKTKSALSAIAFFLVAAFVSLSAPRAVLAAPSLLLSPETVTVTAQDSTTVTVTVNSDATPIFGSDAVISYPATLVDIVSVTAGNFFTDFSYSVSNGTIELHGYFASLYDFKAGSGVLATIVVKPKTAGSTSTLALVCNNSAHTSQIINSQAQNILNCANTNDMVITSASGPTNTPLPTNTTAPGQPTPSPTGSANNQAPVCTGLSVNPVSGFRPLSVNFSCTGSDGNNDITTAEFDFGNGSKALVDRNIGQFGSIATSYTYSTAGNYTVACRLRDNNQRFSDIPDRCKKTITVSSRAVGVAPTRTPTPRPTTALGGSGTAPIASPTIGFGSRVALRPYVTPTGFALPTPADVATAPSGGSFFSSIKNIGLVLGILAIIIIILMILRRLGRKQDDVPLQ